MKRNLSLLMLLIGFTLLNAKDYQLTSPDGQVILDIAIQKNILFSIACNNKAVIKKSSIGLQLDGKALTGKALQVRKTKISEVNANIVPPVPNKCAVIRDVYKELVICFSNAINLTFRVYNNGVAYRFSSLLKKEVMVNGELLNLQFADETSSFFPKEDALVSHYERMYIPTQLDTLDETAFCSLPVLMDVNGVKVVFSEAAVSDYPHMFMYGTKGNALKAGFPGYVTKAVPNPEGRDRDQIITAADYIAQTKGKRDYPWRVMLIADDDKQLIESNLVYQLSEPSCIDDPSWIKPGKVAWDWYNANNIYGVDFKAGLNTATYKYYIDFAARYGLEYVILDEGWSRTTTDIGACNKAIDVKELTAYGKAKNVGVILWVLWEPLDKDLSILELYKEWGVKGVKVDFMQRADQYMVNFYERVAAEAARQHLVLDFHGSFKPSGLRRKYPNVLSYEGLKGNENNKWSRLITPEHNVTLPFIRMVAGPMDFTPGAMVNCHKQNHKISFQRPESLGTRSHQVAMYVVFESPLQMLCESPSTYYKEDETTRFIAQIPTVWDETRVLDAALADYVVLARRNKDRWYVGAMTDGTARHLELDLSFLPDGKFDMQLMCDGPNAKRYAQDYRLKTIEVDNTCKRMIKLVAGGGFAAVISKK